MTSHSFTKIRFGLSELDTLISKMSNTTELMYVLKQDGTLVFTLRNNNTILPHPVLSKWESVQMAGIIKEGPYGTFLIDNASWHFKPSPDTWLLQGIRDSIITNTNYNIKIWTLFE